MAVRIVSSLMGSIMRLASRGVFRFAGDILERDGAFEVLTREDGPGLVSPVDRHPNVATVGGHDRRASGTRNVVGLPYDEGSVIRDASMRRFDAASLERRFAMQTGPGSLNWILSAIELTHRRWLT